MSKQTIIKGTLILTITGIATKLLGFYNRIFLTRLIGVKELGVYQLIFPVYLLAFSFCCQGIATTLTKQVSHYIGKKKTNNANAVFRIAIITSFLLSFIACIIINFFSKYISTYLLKNSDCNELLKIISVAIPFISIKACINSYFVGIDKPEYQGISHFVEQIVRIVSTYLISYLWIGKIIDAKVAVLGVISGEIFATLLSLILYYRYSNKYGISYNREKVNKKVLRHDFIQDAVPITTTNLMLTMFSSLEAILLPAMLFKYYLDSDMAMEMYGIITGIVIPFLLFPSTITTSLSTMLLPAVSYANAQKNSKTIKKAIRYSVMFCCFLGIVTCFAYLLLGKWACQIAFNNIDAGIILQKMCFLCPFIYMAGNMSAILNGLDKAFYNLMFNIANIGIRIIFTVTLVPTYGIYAYILGMAVSYIILNLLMFFAIYFTKSKEV